MQDGLLKVKAVLSEVVWNIWLYIFCIWIRAVTKVVTRPKNGCVKVEKELFVKENALMYVKGWCIYLQNGCNPLLIFLTTSLSGFSSDTM